MGYAHTVKCSSFK